MRKLFVNAALAAFMVAGFTACVSESLENAGQAADETVNLKFVDEGFTRAVEAGVEAQTTVSLTAGYALFVNSNTGLIAKVTQLIADAPAAADIAAGTKVQIASSMTINKVSAHADKVYIIGNLPSGVLSTAPAVNATIASVNATSIAIATQADATKATLYGSANVTKSEGSITATVALKAIDSRIEIGKISYSGSYLTAWKVDGIFLDHYYPTMGVDGTSNAYLFSETVADNAAADLKYTDNVSPYLTAAAGILYDWNSTPIAAAGTPLAVTPASSKVWAYNTLTLASNTAANNPRIIIRLSAMTYSGGSAYSGETRYLTVKKFLDSSTNAEVTFTQGKIYKIADLSFTDNNLAPIPNESSVTVSVSVTAMQWNVENVKAGFDD
ncbi:MAG: hypothetical protein LBL97_07605 [Prevotellaceae bacterium]|jgi:hypothetical protein|nr:hypothetical protein [Prevotellaceae bacterium]